MGDNKRSFAAVASLVFAGVNALGIVVSAFYSFHMLNKCVEIYGDLGTDVPIITQQVINVREPLWMLATGLLLAIVGLKELIRPKWVTLLLNGVFVLFGIAFWALFIAILILPLANHVQ